jgi:signal peptidase I
MRWCLAFAVGVGAGVWVGCLRRQLLVVTVNGHSMLPAYVDGDRVLVVRDRPVRAGDVVVADIPGHAARVGAHDVEVNLPEGRVLKRVAALSGDPVPDGIAGVDGGHLRVPLGKLVLLGDNATASVDSRHYGYVDAREVVGVVVRRMA